MKFYKTLSLISLIAIIFVAIFAFSACTITDGTLKGELENVKLPQLNDNQFVIVIKETDQQYNYYTLTITELNNKSTVIDALQYLEKNKNLTLEYTYGTYGAYFTQIGNLHDGDNGRYIMFYTSVEQDFDTSAYAKTYNCGGVNVTTSGQSADKMHVEGGAVIYIELTAF